MTASPNDIDLTASANDAATSKQMKTGIIGSIVAAICCFTPFLVIAFGIAGLTSWLGWIDYLLFPMLFISLAVLGHALYLKFGKIGPNPTIMLIIATTFFSNLLSWLNFSYAIRISLLAALLVAVYGVYLKSKNSTRLKTS